MLEACLRHGAQRRDPGPRAPLLAAAPGPEYSLRRIPGQGGGL